MTGPQVNSVLPTRSSQLSPRDLRILTFAADGLQTKDIAEQIGKSAHYVKVLRMKLCIKMGADNMNHAIGMGFRRGLIK